MSSRVGRPLKMKLSFTQIFWYELPLDNLETKLNSFELLLLNNNTY